VGVNARTGDTGLVPSHVLKDAVDGEAAGGSGGSFNNVYRPDPNGGGWRGGKGKEVETVVHKAQRPPPPPKRNWDPNRQATGGGPAPVAMVGMGGEGGGNGLTPVSVRTTATNHRGKFVSTSTRATPARRP
jgi:hypothetical protein